MAEVDLRMNMVFLVVNEGTLQVVGGSEDLWEDVVDHFLVNRRFMPSSGRRRFSGNPSKGDFGNNNYALFGSNEDYSVASPNFGVGYMDPNRVSYDPRIIPSSNQHALAPRLFSDPHSIGSQHVYGPSQQLTSGPMQSFPHDQQAMYATSNGPDVGFQDFSTWLSKQQPWAGFSKPSADKLHYGLVAQSADYSISDTCVMVDSWIPDSGVSSHMTSNPNLVQGAQVYTGSERVVVGNGMTLPVTHVGQFVLSLPFCTLYLNNVLLVLGLSKNILSISQLVFDNPCLVQFSHLGFFLKSLT